MSPSTTPNRAFKHREANVVKEPRIFEAYDSQTRSIQSLAAEHDITKQTAYNWLK
jgi:transposase-like protein